MKIESADRKACFLNKRSAEYMAGYLALVESAIMNKPFSYPYPAGSVQADAFIFGMTYAKKVLERVGQ